MLWYLSVAEHNASSFDAAISGPSVHESDILVELARVLKPGGRVYVREAVAATRPRAADSLRSALKLAGFIDISQVSPVYCATRRELVRFQHCSDLALSFSVPTWFHQSPLLLVALLDHSFLHPPFHSFSPPSHTFTSSSLHTRACILVACLISQILFLFFLIYLSIFYVGLLVMCEFNTLVPPSVILRM